MPDKVWFGYRIHLIADTAYELPVAWKVAPASTSEVKTLEGMLPALFREEPELAARCRDFSADRGLDSGPLKASLWDRWQIRPLVPARNLWREEEGIAECDPAAKRTRALDPRRADTIVHTEQGEVRCICPVTGTERPMAFQGFEASRSTLKYRCPAAARGEVCAGRARCHRRAGCTAGPHGRIVRIPLARHDRRIFTPTPHGSPSWRRGYRRRAALERIYRRVDHDFGLERHFVRGQTRMQTRIGLSIAVMMAAALGHVRAGRHRYMRSLVQPFADTG